MLDHEVPGHPYPDSPYPHCSATTVHAPGECHYCDRYPFLQGERMASGEPFSLSQANGWSGNVAVQAGELHTHMGASFVVGEGEQRRLVEASGPCPYPRNRGWRCRRGPHSGPCALEPRWWNLLDRLRLRG